MFERGLRRMEGCGGLGSLEGLKEVLGGLGVWGVFEGFGVMDAL